MKGYMPRIIRITALSVSYILSAALLIPVGPRVHAATGLLNRYDRMTSSIAGETATHLIGFDITNTSTSLGSIEIEFCSNDAIPGAPCTPPAGFDLSPVQLASQSGETGFNMSASNNRILLTRTSSMPSGGPSSYQFDQVTHPANPGSYFIRVRTFASNDGSGSSIEEGGIALVINMTTNVSAEVPPWLKFCAGISIDVFDCSSANTYQINFGEFNRSSTSTATSQMVVATNAASGFSITLSGNTLTSGNNVIPSSTSPRGSSIGASQFGLNLRANSSPGVGNEPAGIGTGVITADYTNPNQFAFENGDVLVSSASASDDHKFTVSYIVNVDGNQSPGVYATTMSYIALANF